VKQPDVPLRNGLNHFTHEGSIRTKIIEKPVSVREELEQVSLKGVAAKLKPGKELVTEDWHTNTLIAARLASVFGLPAPLRSLDPKQKADDLRDITKGYIFDIMKEINKDPIAKTKLNAMKEGDLALQMLMADVKKSKEVTNSLKAKERSTVTERLRMMTDAEREITKDLMDRGLAPYIVKTQDRLLFAKDVAEKEKENQVEEDIGVGRTVDDDDLGILQLTEDQGQRGNYGDFSGSNAAAANMYEAILGNDFERDDGQI
jgi:hypothetical protein